ncbi:MAG: sugar ABC transporter substrate-binding protein [Anaerolineae bacterium]
MKPKFWLPILSLIVVLSMVLTGCAPATPQPQPTAAPPTPTPVPKPTAVPPMPTPTSKPAIAPTKPAKEMVIGVSLDKLFLGRQAEMSGVRAAAEELGVKLLELVADNDPQLQNTQIESFITQGVDGIMIVAVDNTAILTAVDKAEAAGIPVVTFDRKVDHDWIAYHSGLDSYADGKACGGYVKSLNDGKPHLVLNLLGALNDDNAIQRRDGFEDALKGQTNLTIIQEPTDWNADKALNALTNVLTAHPDLWAVEVPSDFMQDSIKTAIEEAGKLRVAGEPGHIIVCTIDGAEPGYRATVEGWTDAVVALPLFDLGRAALENMVLVIQGGTPKVKDQRFPGTLYTYKNAADNADKIWGATGAKVEKPTPSAAGLTIGVSLDKLFLGRQAEMKGVREAAEKLGVKLLELVADNDPQLQNTQIESFITQGVDGIMIVAVDNTAILTAVDKAEAAGIPVVTFDRKVDHDWIAYHSGLDSYADGKACGGYVKSLNDGKPHLVLNLLGALNDDNAIQRRDGFEDALKGQTNLTIIQEPTDWNADKALNALTNVLTAHPDLWAVEVPSDFMQDSIKTAIEEAGKLRVAGEPGHIIVCTIDGAEPGYRATVEGWTDAVVALPLFDLGRAALENMVLVIQGGTPKVKDQRFPGTLYTYKNAADNADKIWGATFK